MTELQILFRINEMTGKSITLTQALEVMGRVVFTGEALEEEWNEFDMNELIRDTIVEVGVDKEFSC